MRSLRGLAALAVAAGLAAGCGSAAPPGASSMPGADATTSTPGSGPAPASSRPPPASTSTTVPPAPSAAVPANFEPVSASFWSPARGVALGGAGRAGGSACTARLAVTADGGAHWRFLTAPDVRLFNIAGNSLTQSSAVRGVVFAGRLSGWLYGPGLYATHDGGAHWSRIVLGGDVIPTLGGGVVTMAASSGSTYAVVSPDPFHGKPDELYKSPAGQARWSAGRHGRPQSRTACLNAVTAAACSPWCTAPDPGPAQPGMTWFPGISHSGRELPRRRPAG